MNERQSPIDSIEAIYATKHVNKCCPKTAIRCRQNALMLCPMHANSEAQHTQSEPQNASPRPKHHPTRIPHLNVHSPRQDTRAISRAWQVLLPLQPGHAERIAKRVRRRVHAPCAGRAAGAAAARQVRRHRRGGTARHGGGQGRGREGLQRGGSGRARSPRRRGWTWVRRRLRGGSVAVEKLLPAS